MTKRRNNTHYTRLLDYLKKFKSITSLDAIKDLETLDYQQPYMN